MPSPMRAAGETLAVLCVAFALLFGAPRPALSAACWAGEPPSTLEELAHVIQNRAEGANRYALTGKRGPAVLALSDGASRLGYAAGLLVGWTEVGLRPEFAVVTAVGASALLAPFAFIGNAGDRYLAALFMCSRAKDWPSLAREAARSIDGPVLDAIARRHQSGARLLVALPGSPSRKETILDLGALAASGRADVNALTEIMLAAVDVTYAPRLRFGMATERSFIFRELGAGAPFLWPPASKTAFASITLIHSEVMFPDEADSFASSAKSRHPGVAHWLVPAIDIEAESRRLNADFRFASVKPMLNIARTRAAFDMTYERELFRYAYRQGRMNKEWHSSLPSLKP